MRMSENTPSIRHFDAIQASSPGTFDLKATISSYESWCFADVLYQNTKKPAVKTAGGTCQDGVLMATMRCAGRHTRGHQLHRCRQRAGHLVNLVNISHKEFREHKSQGKKN